MYEKFHQYNITLVKGKSVGVIQAIYVKEDESYRYFVNVATGKEVKVKR